MTDLTGRAQVAALRTIAEFIAQALENGARHIPNWHISPYGYAHGTILFDEAPTETAMAPWRLAAGACTVTYNDLHLDDGRTTSTMRFEYKGLAVSLMTAFPATGDETAVKTLGVLA